MQRRVLLILPILLIVLGIYFEISKDINNIQVDNREVEELMLLITVNKKDLLVELEDNSSVDALIELLNEGPIVLNMNDYANMEKVGLLPSRLPRNDVQMNVDSNDVILYQGDYLVIYYDKNSWSFTKIGTIINVSQEELIEILGKDDVSITLSLVE